MIPAPHGQPARLRPRLATLLLLTLFVLLALELWTRRQQGARQAASPPLAAVEPPVQPMPTGELGADERNTIAIYRRVSPAVVAVANRTLVRGGRFGFQIFEVPQGSGSGFVWDRDGHIISNYHVVHQASAITVTFPDGSSFDAQVVGVDPDHDLAVLRIAAPADKLTVIATGVSRELQVGQSVLAIGNPFGLDTTLTVGIVSALGRTITSITERRIQDVIQTDAAINPGNSGGPLLDSSGRLIGINTAILSPSGAYAGIGFAVPVDTISRVVPQLIARGKVSRAGLGIELMPNHVARRAGIRGAAILLARGEGPAARAGLQGVSRTRFGDLLLGDVIVGLNETAINDPADLYAVTDRLKPGDEVTIRFLRGRAEQSVRARLQEE